LKSEELSTRPEAIVHAPLRNLNSELFSTRLETKDSEPDRALARPLTCEEARFSVPVRP
jgi:hypothetical protein